MKTTIKRISLFAVGIAATMGLWSCNDDNGYSVGNFAISWGTAQSQNVVQLDNGATLNIITSLYPTAGFTAGQRVIVDYTVLGDGNSPKTYNVRLNDYTNVLTKNPVLQSFIDAEPTIRPDSIGNDPVVVNEAWFSAGKYLNIDFGLKVGNTNTKHLINLVVDNVNVPAERGDSVYVTLRQNAYNDPPTYRGWGYVSFDITSLVPSDKTSIPVKLLWKDYNNTTHFDTGTFNVRTDGTTTVTGKSRRGTKEGNQIEVK